jgi:hypothetical protein
MRSHAHLNKRVKDMHLQNPFLSITEISEKLGCSYLTVCGYLEHKDNYKLVKGLNIENEYFLFTDVLEKKIISTPDKKIENGFEFNANEKTYLRGYGFKF